MTPEEQKVAMDAAGEAAAKELMAMDQNITVPMARWFMNHYAKAGHKRLGRALVAFAKEMKDTGPKNWATAAELKQAGK